VHFASLITSIISNFIFFTQNVCRSESPLYGQMFFRAASFTTFFCSLKLITSNSHQPTPSQYFMAGASTGFVISFIEVSNYLIMFMTTDRLISMIKLTKKKRTKSAQYLILSTALSHQKPMHCFLNFQTPIDLVKTKLQIQVFANKHDSSYKPQYKSGTALSLTYSSNYSSKTTKRNFRNLWK
jgi:hypothetical protein